MRLWCLCILGDASVFCISPIFVVYEDRGNNNASEEIHFRFSCHRRKLPDYPQLRWYKNHREEYCHQVVWSMPHPLCWPLTVWQPLQGSAYDSVVVMKLISPTRLKISLKNSLDCHYLKLWVLFSPAAYSVQYFTDEICVRHFYMITKIPHFN